MCQTRVGSKAVMTRDTYVESGTPRGSIRNREHMHVLGYHMQTIIPDFRRVVYV